jgi:hypothetical protein
MFLLTPAITLFSQLFSLPLLHSHRPDPYPYPPSCLNTIPFKPALLPVVLLRSLPFSLSHPPFLSVISTPTPFLLIYRHPAYIHLPLPFTIVLLPFYSLFIFKLPVRSTLLDVYTAAAPPPLRLSCRPPIVLLAFLSLPSESRLLLLLTYY